MARTATKTARRVDFDRLMASMKKLGPAAIIELASVRAPKRTATAAQLAAAGNKPGSSRKAAARKTPKKPARAGRGSRQPKDKTQPAAA